MSGPVRTTLGATTTTVTCVVPVFLLGGLAVQAGDELGFTPAGLGLAVAVYFGMSALTSVPAGALVERFGATLTARAAIALSGSCLLAIAIAARSYLVLVLLLAASAGANGLGQLASNAALTRVPAARQGLAFGVKQAAIPMSTLLAGFSVPVVALTVGWRWAFGLAAVAAAGALLLVPRDRTGPARRPSRGAGARTSPATTALVVIGVAVALGAASAGVLGVFLVDSAVAGGVAPGLAGLVLALGSLACVAGRIAGGALVDRRGSQTDIAIVAVLLVAGAVGLSLLAVPGPVPLITGVLLGFGLGWAFPGLVNVAVVRLHPQQPAAATSITQTGVYTGGCLGPLAYGAAADQAGYPVAWLGAAVVMLLAAALILLARRLLAARPAHTGDPQPVR